MERIAEWEARESFLEWWQLPGEKIHVLGLQFEHKVPTHNLSDLLLKVLYHTLSFPFDDKLFQMQVCLIFSHVNQLQ